MIESLLAVAGLGVLLVGALILFIILGVLLETEKEGFATLLVISLLASFYPERHTIAELISSNVLTVFFYSLGYIIVGITWSFIKWFEFIKKNFDLFNTHRNRFIDKVGPVEENWKLWMDDLNKSKVKSYKSGYERSCQFYETDTKESVVKAITPLASLKKAAIVSWISYWPISFVTTFLNNPVRKFFTFIYTIVSKMYEKVSNRVASNYIN
jgi:hypothetical protein